jgi:hypothetical protein
LLDVGMLAEVSGSRCVCVKKAKRAFDGGRSRKEGFSLVFRCLCERSEIKLRTEQAGSLAFEVTHGRPK